MVQIKKILASTDFSEPAELGIQYAAELARKFDAELHLVHVVEETYYYDTFPVQEYYDPGIVTNDLAKHGEEQLRKTAKALPEEINANTYVVQGHVASSIVDTAESIGADLIVISTHGRTGLTRLLLGSVAEHVVRNSPVPVFTVRQPGAKKN